MTNKPKSTYSNVVSEHPPVKGDGVSVDPVRVDSVVPESRVVSEAPSVRPVDKVHPVKQVGEGVDVEAVDGIEVCPVSDEVAGSVEEVPLVCQDPS